MRTVGITADNPQDFFINGYSDNENRHIALPYDMVCAADIDSLNLLAARIAQLDPAELPKLNAALQQKQGFENIGQIIDFTYNVDYFVHIPGVNTSRDLGDYYLNKSGMVQMPEEWKNGVDLAAFGKNAAEQEQGSFTPYGYLVKSGDEWERHFEGRELPEEYRIMSYPKPEQSEQDKIFMDAAATEQTAPATAIEPQKPRPVIPIVLTSEKPAEKMKEITDRLEQGITELFDSERYKEYLKVMSRFHNYSFNNTLLIAMQKPDASLVAGFTAWKNNFQRNVIKGEKGIKIIAPSPFKVKQQTEKIDPHTRKPVMGKDGKPVMEEKEVTIPAYKVVSVFDVSQTEGKELPDIAVDELTGDVNRYKDFFIALEKTSPVPIGFEKITGGAHGYYHLGDKRITRAFAVPVQPENYLKAAEQTTEQNYNMIDGQINNTPTVPELEAKVKAGETISLVDLAEAVKADKERGKAAKTEKKPSIRAQLKADKEKTAQKKATKSKNHELEV